MIESTRRVIQCACERTLAYAGDERAREAGWCRVVVEGALLWRCPSCWTPQPLPPRPLTVPPYLTVLFTSEQLQLVNEQFALLAGDDDARSRALVAQLVAVIPQAPRKRQPALRMWAAKRGHAVEEPPRRRRKA